MTSLLEYIRALTPFSDESWALLQTVLSKEFTGKMS
jgi:hypothetical protein